VGPLAEEALAALAGAERDSAAFAGQQDETL
jgi:hypothetical protein